MQLQVIDLQYEKIVLKLWTTFSSSRTVKYTHRPNYETVVNIMSSRSRGVEVFLVNNKNRESNIQKTKMKMEPTVTTQT